MLIPVLLAGKEAFVKFFIVPGCLPPLLSKPCMKRLGGILNLANDTFSGNFKGSPFSLPMTDSVTGHSLVHLPRMPLH